MTISEIKAQLESYKAQISYIINSGQADRLEGRLESLVEKTEALEKQLLK